MKFAFTARCTFECVVHVDAENEQAAWSDVLDGNHKIQSSDLAAVRKPIYKRAPEHDQGGYDL